MLKASVLHEHCSICVVVNGDIKNFWVGIRQHSTQGKLHERHHPRGTLPERHNALGGFSTQGKINSNDTWCELKALNPNADAFIKM